MDNELKEFYLHNNQLCLKAKNGDSLSTIELYKLLLINALDLMPIKYPGLEEVYPPMCSIISHKFIKEAEMTLLPLAELGNIQAQSYLIDLYYNGFEVPQIDKAEYWLLELSKISNLEKEKNQFSIRQKICP